MFMLNIKQSFSACLHLVSTSVGECTVDVYMNFAL